VQTADERVRPAGSEVERLVADASKARERLEWAPTVALDAGLELTLEWMRDRLSDYKPAIYNV
jgi:nucleoside-diphosphate-sugar epimerase